MITVKSKKAQVNGNDVGNKENHVSQVIIFGARIERAVRNAFDWVIIDLFWHKKSECRFSEWSSALEVFNYKFRGN